MALNCLLYLILLQGIQEPIRFALETKAKIYPTTERFWMIVRKHHFTQQFVLALKRVSIYFKIEWLDAGSWLPNSFHAV